MGVTPIILCKSIWSLGLNMQPTNPLRFMVGNGNEIECYHLCEGVVVHVQGQIFTVDLHVLPLCWADLVLGIQWLKSLGLILIEYNDLTMKFMYSDKVIEFKGDSDTRFNLITTPKLQCLVQTNGTNGFFHIYVIPLKPPSTQTNSSIHHYP